MRPESRAVLCVLGLAACGPAPDPVDDPGSPGIVQFSCTSLEPDATQMFCDDFNAQTQLAWIAQAGSWQVMDAHYFGTGPEDLEGAACDASRMSASVRDGARATDLVFHARLRSVQRVDKTIVLRVVDASNRLELNFRAAPYDDLIVQDLRSCAQTMFTQPGEVPVPHAMGADLEVEIELVGERLEVRANGAEVLDRSFPVAVVEGGVGVAVIDRALTAFDDIWSRRL